MCGVAGFFSERRLAEPDQVRIKTMTTALQHRGPDSNGIWVGRNCALGHARLAIIDLATGQQPMHLPEHQLSISYNGEIYNHHQLRTQLIALGARFHGSSDTEVILHAYNHWGIEGFKRLRGMFAFALWDERKHEGTLVRDPMGIKPLFFHQKNKSVAFASEAKGILAGLRQAKVETPGINPEALHLLLNFRYLPGNLSLFEGIKQLQPGEIFRWSLDDGLRSLGTLLSKPERQVVHGRNQRNLPQTIRDTLGGSVEAHMVADVEVGAYLSGGIDSAAVVALAHPKPRCFTLDVGDDPQEARNAERSAQLLGVEQQTGTLDDDNSDLSQLIWHLETPKINAYQVQQIARFARTRVKVCLSGIGSDELFLGYNVHSIMRQAHQLKRWLPGMVHGPVGALIAGSARSLHRQPWSEPERAGLMLRHLGDWSSVYGLVRNIWDSPNMRQTLYGPRLLDTPPSSVQDWLANHWPESSTDPVAAMATFERHNKLVNDLLWNEDRCSMSVGLEVRTPFVDQELLNVTAGLSTGQLMPGGQKKGLLRTALREVLPAEILNRPKSGFQVASGPVFHAHFKQLADQLLSPEAIRKTGLFNPATIQKWRQLPATKAYRWHYFFLHLVLMTQLWLHLFEDNQWPTSI